MLALSIVAPNGTNIAVGRKTLEIRSWRPRQLPLRDLLIIENLVFLTGTDEVDPDGIAVAVVNVTRCMPGSRRNWKQRVPRSGSRTSGPGTSRMSSPCSVRSVLRPDASFTM